MIDIETRKIIDMIPSREYEDVKAWLETYPNIKIVSRDGSHTYRKAICGALPNAIQVSDRFHLIKNLIDYAKEHLKKELGVRISIPVPDEIINEAYNEINNVKEHRSIELKEKYERIKELSATGHDKSMICKILNMDVRTYDKLIIATTEEIETRISSKKEKNHENKVRQKLELVNEVRELKRLGLSERKISKRIGLSRNTVKKYLDEKFTPIHAAYNEKRIGKLTQFENDINSMLIQGVKGTIIEKTIREKGYSGSSTNFRHYVSDWKRKRKNDSSSDNQYKGIIEIIERKNLFKLLYSPPEKVKCITRRQLDSIFEHYPCFLKVYMKVWDFKHLLFEKAPDMLSSWLESIKTLRIAEFNSFANGINLDIDAVKNAIELPYSNGLAEGKINKIKVIKRIMYGRCNFIMLKLKTLLQEI